MSVVTAGPRKLHPLQLSSRTLTRLLSTAKILRLMADGTPIPKARLVLSARWITGSEPEEDVAANLSSASGLGGDWGMTAYNAAKGAVTNFTRALALEYGSRGVRINAVAPSLTSTEATFDLERNEAVRASFRDRLPIGRAATPDEIAGVIAFLASEDARFVNGVILPVDGGLGASNGQPNFLSLLGQG